VFAKDVFQRGAETFTLMLSVSGAGAVAGALFVAGFGHIRKKGFMTLIIITLLGLLMIGFAFSTWVALSCAILFLCGAALIACFAMITSLVQLITSDSMRGRVMSVYNVAFRGGMPIGSLFAGWLIKEFSAPAIIAANGVLLMALALYFLFVQRRVATL
jgi:predicted MFS family arabinose efflux permease